MGNNSNREDVWLLYEVDGMGGEKVHVRLTHLFWDSQLSNLNANRTSSSVRTDVVFRKLSGVMATMTAETEQMKVTAVSCGVAEDEQITY